MGPSSWGYNVTMHFGKVQPLQGLRSKVSEREREEERARPTARTQPKRIVVWPWLSRGLGTRPR